MRRATPAVALATALCLAGCGSAGSTAASRPQPAAPITLSASVGAGAVHVSPATLGAGPVLLTVTNQDERAIALSLVRDGRSLARTAPLNPQGVTQVKLDLSPGSYTVTATAAGRRSDAARARAAVAALTTTLHVGASRPSAGEQVLMP